VICEVCGVEHGLDHREGPEGGMRVLVTTHPKSGTNLLIQLTGSPAHIPVGFPVLYEGASVRSGNSRAGGDAITIGDTYKKVESFTGAAFGHVPWTEEMERSARKQKTVVAVLIRDPRDVIVSHYFHVKRTAEAAFNFMLPDGTRLADSPDPIADLIRVAPFVWRKFIPWLSHADLVVRFADLVGDPLSIATKLYNRAGGRVFGVSTPAQMTERINPHKSPTFRKGSTGDWRNHFTSAHVQQFNQAMGDIANRLGYL